MANRFPLLLVCQAWCSLNRVRYMSDTSAGDERTLRWSLDEYVWGDPAGGDASGTAPGRAQRGSQASTGRHQVVRGSRRESAADSASLRLQSRHGEPLGEGLPRIRSWRAGEGEPPAQESAPAGDPAVDGTTHPDVAGGVSGLGS